MSWQLVFQICVIITWTAVMTSVTADSIIHELRKKRAGQ